jgi:formamidopyrimidine-DNA glycosylase
MPELAEVYFYAKQWRPGIGEKIESVQCHPQTRVFRECPAEALNVLLGCCMGKILTHGKQMAFSFDTGRWLILHLGMAGKLYCGPVEWAPHKHDHLVLKTPSRALVFSDYRQFGKVVLSDGSNLPDPWANLPPQPHDTEFTFSHFKAILQKAPNRSLKGLLLDQSAFPGVGNWMADEILWRSRIHPADTASKLSSHRRKKLFEITRTVCGDALRVIGSDWGDPPADWLFPYRWKKGGICPVSKRPLVHETIAGRTTCFAPAIQKLAT